MMQEIPTRLIGIDGGDVLLFADFEDDGAMWTGTGERECRRHVRFARAFRAPPQVFVALSVWDFHAGFNTRADLGTDNVTAEGFDIVFRTWEDTRVARARARWMAIGALRDEDDWQLD
ncbi:MAG: H-type lectin domain-containing protein [Roseovarius sp.]